MIAALRQIRGKMRSKILGKHKERSRERERSFPFIELFPKKQEIGMIRESFL